MPDKYKMTINLDLEKDVVFGRMCAALGVSKTERINLLIEKDLDYHKRLHHGLSNAFPSITKEDDGIRERAIA